MGTPRVAIFTQLNLFGSTRFTEKIFCKTPESVQSSGGLNSMGVTINASQSVL
jgi:hypothetical protein